MTTIHREAIEWCDMWIRSADRSGLPRALFVGDSVTRGYYSTAEQILSPTAACARLATSRFVSDPVYHQELALVLNQYRFQVIHFNNGLHGWDFSEADYADGLQRTIEVLRRLAPGAALVWAHSTPIRRSGDLTNFDPRHARIVERNRLASVIMADLGIPVDDLFTSALNQLSWFSNDGIHYTTEGCARLGEQAAASVMPLLPATG